MPSDIEYDAISIYLDRVYSPIAIDDGDAIKWTARVMLTEMEERIRAAVSQLEEIGRSHNAAVQEVVAGLKDVDTARREVVQAARTAIKRSEHVQEREKKPWRRRDPEGWWYLGIICLYLGFRLLIPTVEWTEPSANIAFSASFFVVAFVCALQAGRTRRSSQSAFYYLSMFLSNLIFGAIYSTHSISFLRNFASGPMFILSGMCLGSGIIALRFERSRRGAVTSLWNRKA